MSSPADPAIIVVLSRIFPVPPEAGTPRPYHLLTRLSRMARLHCIAAVPGDAAAWNAFAQRAGFARIFESIRVHHRRPGSSALAKAITFLSGSPGFDLRWKDPDAVKWTHAVIRETVASLGPVRFYCDMSSGLPLLPREFWESCLVDAVDVQSLMLVRSIRTGVNLSLKDRLQLGLVLPSWRRFEKRMFEEVGAVTYNSSSDIAYIRRRHPDAPITRVIDGCDFDYFSPEHVADVEERSDELVFTGAMSYPPNLDAARHLVEDVMPQIWKRHPSARALLIGPDPEGRLQRFHDGHQVIVTGFVDDVRPYLKRATIVVSPLRYGAGMKNKLQAGLAMGKAMVASTVTCEGFDELEPGRHALVADDPDEFASAVCALLEDPERRARMGRAGQELIRRYYKWDVAVEALWGALGRCTPCAACLPKAP
jgi:glycosyltransferase involved in cell wall biosynthesis